MGTFVYQRGKTDKNASVSGNIEKHKWVTIPIYPEAPIHGNMKAIAMPNSGHHHPRCDIYHPEVPF